MIGADIRISASLSAGRVLRGLTFELRRPPRIGAWAASPMICTTGSRPKRQAVEGRLERRVRPRLATAPEHCDERDRHCSAGVALDWTKLKPEVCSHGWGDWRAARERARRFLASAYQQR